MGQQARLQEVHGSSSFGEVHANGFVPEMNGRGVVAEASDTSNSSMR